MKRTNCLVFAAWLGVSAWATAQTPLRGLTVDDLVAWQRISAQDISDNGQWVACKIEPWEGAAAVCLYGAKGEEAATFPLGSKYHFSASENYFVVEQSPRKALTDSLKIRKTDKNKMPMNSLLIHPLVAKGGQEERIDSVKSFELAKQVDWLAYQRGRKDSTLHVRQLDAAATARYHFPAVKAFGFAEKSGMLYYVSAGDSAGTKPGLYVLNTTTGTSTLVKEGDGVFKQITFDEPGKQLAFLYCTHKDSTYKAMALWLSDQAQPARQLVTRGDKAIPDKWVVSEHGKLHFSKSGARLFFGTSPEPKQKDSLLLDENRPNVQVWSWNEPVQYTVQNYNKATDLKRNYEAVYNINKGTVIQLADVELPHIQLGNEGDAPLALLSTSRPYSLSSMWEGRTRSDYYTVSLENGERKLLAQADYSRYHLSPEGKYAYGYAETDSCWYTLSMAEGKRVRLTTPDTFVAWDEDNDIPDYPNAYGEAGWTQHDEALLIYDRYDLWKLDPKGTAQPLRLTTNGRESHISYQWVKLDQEACYIDLKQPQLLKGINEVTKGYGYYRANLSTPAAPRTLLAGDFMLRSIAKAKHTDDVIYTIESFERYPDVLRSSLDFKKSVQLTQGCEQQKGVRWGTAELVSWISLDGRKLEGVVYKPADFDPNKKYPMIVSFYERNSSTLHNYRMPEPHRSTVDYHFYNSNEYIIFNPDIRYKDGYPGESCYNCLMPGVAMLIRQGFVDEKAIGAQGHSWGGYQVAYLATRTDLFAAIESGAPVVNMFSAYGGIRWGSGLARSFQYEHTQSRLAATPWSHPARYFANSPLFTMDKVNTPILIMHNDADGHVPWYQGIEYFVAMKRLGKPCWMLNYTGEPHWPTRIANKVDFQKRMLQFFNHFLKKETMPKWMTDGVEAVDQPFELGY